MSQELANALNGYHIPAVWAQVCPSWATVAHWAQADQTALAQAREIVELYDANAWVFIADCEHFEQFAEYEDRVALSFMNQEQRDALLNWEE